MAEGLSGTEKLAVECPRQIANAHTVFNIANTLILLPFAGFFARAVEALLPDSEEAPGDMSAAELYEVFLSVLELHRLTIVEGSGFDRIVPMSSARASPSRAMAA